MPNFSSWLMNQDPSGSAAKAMQDFAALPANQWPAASNAFEDYFRTIATKAPDGQRNDLLAALGRLHERWVAQERAGVPQQSQGFWQLVIVNGGLIALLAGGLVIAGALVYGIFVSGWFLTSMAQPDYARGLITFLFSFATIAIIVLVAVAIFWMKEPEVKARFDHAKDLITILVGVLGTVLGFYFGTASTAVPAPLAVSAATLNQQSAAAGGAVSISAKASGGTGPYRYDVIITSAVPGLDTSKLEIKGKSSETGQISEKISIPADSKTGDVAVRVVVKDNRGGQAESSEGKFTITPKTQ